MKISGNEVLNDLLRLSQARSLGGSENVCNVGLITVQNDKKKKRVKKWDNPIQSNLYCKNTADKTQRNNRQT